jgi:quinol monooxygenase YgiN
MLAISRFQDASPAFLQQLEQVADFWRARDGNLFVEVLKNVDDESLSALVSKWENVRAYRYAFSGYDAKMLLTPVMLKAIDEPSAYLAPGEF